MSYLKIKEMLEGVPVIDAHEHSCGHHKIIPFSGLTDFFVRGYMSSLLLQADPVPAQIAVDAGKPDKERWQAFVKLWPQIKKTGYGAVVSEVLKKWKLPDDLAENSYEELLAVVKQRSPETGRKLFQEAGIKAVLTHYLAHPSCGGLDNVSLFLDGRVCFEPGFYPLLGTLPLHKFYQISDVKQVGRVIGTEPASLDELAKAVQTIITQTIDKGVVGLKDHAAYSRGLNFGPPDEKTAREELNRLLKGEKLSDSDNCLSDYLFHVILGCADTCQIPVAVHTGLLVDGASHSKTNIKHFVNVLERFPNVKFDLYHLNYPWVEDLLSILERFPNTTANCCWTHALDPEGTEDFLDRAVGLLPAGRIIGFGGDYFEKPEFSAAHLKVAKNNIAGVLSKNITRGRISMKSALETARMWLYENPSTLYLKDKN